MAEHFTILFIKHFLKLYQQNCYFEFFSIKLIFFLLYILLEEKKTFNILTIAPDVD